MNKVIAIILPLVFTAQACNFLGDLGGDQATGSRGVFLSTDSGQTWQEASTVQGEGNMTGAQVLRIVFDSRDSQNLLAVSANGGVYASNSAAASWFRLLPNVAAYDAFLNPRRPEEVFVAGSRNQLAVVLKSTDAGATWTQIFSEPAGRAAVTALTHDPVNPAILFAGLSTGTVLKSINFGTEWTVLENFSDRISRLALTRDGATLYAMSRAQGLRVSSDGGRTWNNPIAVPDSPAAYNDFLIDPTNDATLYLATDKGLYRSSDAGTSWNKLLLPATPQVSNVSAVSVNPRDGRQIFAAIRATVYRSDDLGLTWRTLNLPTGRTIGHLAIDPLEPNRMYAGLK